MKQVNEFVSKYKKEIIIFLVIVALFLIWRKYGYKLERLFKPQTSVNSPIELTDARKVQIESTVDDIHQDIYDTPWTGHDYTPYDKFLGFYDDEIIYGADYYKNFLADGNKMYDDIDSQWYPTGDSADRVMKKLKELGKN